MDGLQFVAGVISTGGAAAIVVRRLPLKRYEGSAAVKELLCENKEVSTHQQKETEACQLAP
jgi:hypothetical protein